jgi:hemerythrin-like domain-containing protein
VSPTQRLEQEHRKVLLLVSVLERLARRVARGERPLEPLDRTLGLLRTFADGAHHGKEERHLFPALVDVGLPAYTGPVACMLAEHDAGRGELGAMLDALFELRCGVDGASGRLTRAASRYVALLREHIAKEDEVLFPIARELLPPGAAAALAAGYADVDLRTYGPGGYARALERIDALAAEVLEPEAVASPRA